MPGDETARTIPASGTTSGRKHDVPSLHDIPTGPDAPGEFDVLIEALRHDGLDAAV